MGLFGAYLAYRHGRKKAERRAQRELDDLRDEMESADDDDAVCDNCGYGLSKHSDDDPPLCPHY